VAHQRLERPPVAGCADHGLGLDPSAVGESDPGRVDRRDRRDHLDASRLDRFDHLAVDDRRHLAAAPHGGEEAHFGPGQPVLGQVSKVHAGAEARDSVGDRRGQVPEPGRQQVAGHGPDPLSQHDVGRGAHREPDLRRAALRQLVGDLHPRASGSDDQHLLPLEPPRIPVLGRVEEVALEGLPPRPLRDDGRLVEARGDDDLRGAKLTGVRVDYPVSGPRLDPLDARAEAELHPVLAGMAFDVPDQLLAAREDRRALGVGTAGQV
jgi:hypothetical protein